MENHRTTWKQSWQTIGGKTKFFRSRWEANYARYLEFQKSQGKIIDWLHEPKTFWFEGIRRGCTSYLPDFEVINLDVSHYWVEVKGWMDSKSRTKIRRFEKYYPKEKLIVIRQKEYKALCEEFSELIPGWE